MAFSEKWWYVYIYLLFETGITAYRPVVIIHGVMSGNESMIPMAERIKQVSLKDRSK
jgi:hypothetical protein